MDGQLCGSEMEPAKGCLYPALGLRGYWRPLCARAVLPGLTSAREETELQDPPQQSRCLWGPQLGRPACVADIDLFDWLWVSQLSSGATLVRKVPRL